MAPTVSLGQLGSEGRTALGNVLVKALSVPVEMGCRLALMVVAAPILGPAAFGSYQFAFAATTMLALCTDLGMGVWTTRALARDRTRAPVIVATALRLRFLASVPYLAVVALVAALAGPGDTRRALALLGVAALVNAFIDYLLAIFRGFERLIDEAHLNVARALLLAGGGLKGRWRFAGRSPRWRSASSSACWRARSTGCACSGAATGSARRPGGSIAAARARGRGRGDPTVAGVALLAALLQGGRRHPQGVHQQRRGRGLQRGLQDLRRVDDRPGGGAGGDVPAAGARQG